MSLPLPLSVAIEQAIEAVLKLDPETRERLQAVDGKLIRMRLTAPTLSFALSVTDGRVYVVGGLSSEADTTISGTLSALRSLAQANDALYRGEVTIEGDLHTGQVIKGIIAGIDPDWEELVSPILGDTLAHRLGRAGRDFGSWLQRTHRSLQQNSSDYLQEESELLAPNFLVAEFCTNVDETRAGADRLEARLQRLERNRAPASAVTAASASHKSDPDVSGEPSC